MPSFFTNRSRISGDFEERDILYEHIGLTPVPIQVLIENVPQWTSYNDISDVVGKVKRKDGRYSPSCIAHNKIAMRANAIASGSHSAGGVATYFGLRYPVVPIGDLNASFPAPSESAVRVFAEDSFFEFAQQVPAEVSIPNFIYELREISSLLPKLEKTLSQTASGGYLNFSFGWKPFIGDLNNLLSLVDSVNLKIKHLKEINGKRSRLSKYKPNCVSLPVIRDYLNTDNFGGLFPLYITDHRTDMRANGFLFANLSGLDSLGGMLRAFAAALGLNNPLKVFWEAIPYSFVVDWLTRISTRLDAFSANPFQGAWEISDMTLSIKSTTIYDVYEYQSDWVDSSHHIIGSIRYDRYVRYGHLPVDLASFNLVEMTPQQLVLYLALLTK